MVVGTILVVDDEPGLADLFTTFLENEYSVRTAYDGLEAVELFDELVDLVILDRIMPGIGGDQILAWIKEEGYNCSVIVVSSLFGNDPPLPAEPDAYLVKPVSREELRAYASQFMQ